MFGRVYIISTGSFAFISKKKKERNNNNLKS